MKDKEIIRLKESIEKFKNEQRLEEELFDDSKDIKDKEFHLSNIEKLDVKLVRLGVKLRKLTGTYVEEEDTIKAPWDYVASPEEFGFCGAFRCDEDVEYDDEY